MRTAPGLTTEEHSFTLLTVSMSWLEDSPISSQNQFAYFRFRLSSLLPDFSTRRHSASNPSVHIHYGQSSICINDETCEQRCIFYLSSPAGEFLQRMSILAHASSGDAERPSNLAYVEISTGIHADGVWRYEVSWGFPVSTAPVQKQVPLKIQYPYATRQVIVDLATGK